MQRLLFIIRGPCEVSRFQDGEVWLKRSFSSTTPASSSSVTPSAVSAGPEM